MTGEVRERTHQQFRAQKFFAPLDGVRALSVVFVILWHLPEKDVWSWLNGWLGVTMFFVLSGFLITTLALRESRGARSGGIDLGAFYIRRVHRILPLYFATLGIYAILSGIFGWIAPSSDFVSNLPYYLTVSLDVVREHEPFRHSWSLGIEEKFYLLWPLALVFLLPARHRWRYLVTFVLLGVFVVGGDYARLYVPIVLGCLMAFAFDDGRAYGLIRAVVERAGRAALPVLAALALIVQLYVRDVPSGSAVYAALVAAAIGVVLIRASGPAVNTLSHPVARWIGKRSYGIYLLHPLVIHGLDEVVALNDSSVAVCGVRVVLVVLLSFGVADLAHRFIEVPLVRRGHRVAAAYSERRLAATVA